VKRKGGSRPAGRVKAQPLLAGEDVVVGEGLRLLLKLDLMKRETLKGSMAKARGKMKWEEEEAWGRAVSARNPLLELLFCVL